MRRPAVVLLALFALLLSACSGGDSETEGESSTPAAAADQTTTTAVVALDTAAAWSSVEAAIASSLADDADGDGSADLDACPFGIDSAALLEAAFVDGAPIVERALVAPDEAVISDDEIATGFTCGRNGEEDAGVGFWVNEGVTDLAAFHEVFAGDGPVTISVTEGDELAGGQLFDVCVSFADFPEGDYCEVDWMDGEILLGLFVYGDGADGVDLSGARAVLVAELADLVEQMANG